MNLKNISLINKIKEHIKNKGHKDKNDNEKKGIIIFSNVKEAMKCEQLLKKTGYNIKVIAPPIEIREGCDLAIEYDLIDEFGIKNKIEKYNENNNKNKIKVLKYISSENYNQQPLDLVKIKKVDDFTLIRCGNMKITLDKEGLIVNISGGGCPDVPYLAYKLKGKNIKNIKVENNPKNLGYSLCAYTLNKAFEKGKESY